MARAENGASVEVIVVKGEPRIQLVRGPNFKPEILTRDEAAKLVDYNQFSAKDCDGDCWVCLLDEAVSQFR